MKSLKSKLSFRNILQGFVVIALILASLPCQAESLRGQRGTIGTASVGGSFYMWAAGWSKLLEEHTEYALAVESTPGAFHNIRLLELGELDFALSFFPALSDIKNGQNGVKRLDLEKSRVMFAYAPYYMIVLAPQSLNISNFRELQGKKINLLPKGGGADVYNNALFSLLKITPERIVNSSAADAIASLNDGVVDAVAGIGAHPWGPALEAEVNQPMRILAYDPKDLDAVLPYLSGWFKVRRPEGGYKAAGGGQDTLGYMNVMLASSDVPDDTVYAMTKLFFQNREYFKDIEPNTLNAQMEDILESPVKIHPGAVRYYREQGIDIPNELVE